MTHKKQIRAVVLAVLMVSSVFAGSIAFAGSAAAASHELTYDTSSAVHFYNGSNAVIEVAFNEQVSASSLTAENFSVTDDGSEVSVAGVSQGPDGRVLIDLGAGEDSVVKSNDIEVTLASDIQNATGGALSNPDTYSVDFAATTINEGDGDTSAYKGSKVAVTANEANAQVVVEDDSDDFSYSFRGSTGANSTVFLLDTATLETGDYTVTVNGTTTDLTVRELGLDLSVDDLNVTTDDDIEGTVTANSGDRDVRVQLFDADDDEVANDTITLNGQGEADFSLPVDTAGDYTVEATDLDTGVALTSDTVTVTKAAGSTSDFATSVVTDQSGDVVEIPVTMRGTDTAEVTIGGDNVGYTADVTVEDGNDDGEVVLLFNTYDADNVNSFDVDDSDDDVTVDGIDTGVTQVLDAGDYDLEVSTGGDADNVGTLALEERSTDSQSIWTAPTGDAADLTETEDVYDAIDSETLTQTDSVANGDVVVHQVVATGLEGAYETDNLDAETNLTIEQANPGPNREPKVLNDSAATVIADGDNDTYFFVYDLSDMDASRTEFFQSGSATERVEDDDAYNATFTVLEDGELTDVEDGEEVSAGYDVVAPELSLDEDPVTVSAAANQTVSGTATVAPGTELTIRVKSTGDTQPRFLKTKPTSVQADGTFSSTFDFSEQKAGDEFEVTVSVDSGTADDITADGTVGDAQAEETTTETTTEETTAEETTEETTTEKSTTEETTEGTTTETTEEPAEETTESSTPGFGIAVALVALVAAALLAVRRD
ncbi:BGTF surface domain-containing protein [Haloferax sp. DFSO52]|uniref:BGTF surface domain-containing protein n=1 Tax=Haloferax sp. DFSO52 TaxID=3388505 RepID=UPI003A8C6009